MKALILAALVVLAGCDPAQNTVPQLVKCQPGATITIAGTCSP